MQTECARCHKVMDTVQGYKFSPTEYLCMSCYDEFKAERAAKSKKQQKNPLLDRYGAQGISPAAQAGHSPPAAAPPAAPAPPEQPSTAPTTREPAAPQPPQEPAPPSPQPAPRQQMFAPKSAAPTPAAPPVGALKNQPPKKSPTADTCDVCQKPIPDFKVPLTDGKQVCMECNKLLRDVAKSLVLNVQCPQCGHKFRVVEE